MHLPELLGRLDGPPVRLPTWFDRLAEAWTAATPRKRRVATVLVVCVLAVVVLRPRPHPWGPTRPILVAARDLQAGQVLGPDDLALRPWPDQLRPTGALDGDRQATGTRLAHAVAAGVPLTLDALAGRSPAQDAPPGWGALAVPIDQVPDLDTGMVVDVHGGDGGMVTGAVVLVVADATAWLALPRDQMAVLARALAWGPVHVVVWSDADRP